MADGFSTDSYPKPQAPTSLLDNVQKLGAVAMQPGQLQMQKQQLESNNLSIDKQKLDLVNQRFGELSKGFTKLIAENGTQDQYRQYIQNQVKLGYIPPEMAANIYTTMPNTANMTPTQGVAAMKSWGESNLQHAQTINDAINWHFGQPGTMDVGNATVPVRTSPKFGVQSTGAPIQHQPSPNREEYQGGQRTFRGAQPPEVAPGAVAAPPMAPGYSGPAPAPVAPQSGLRGAVAQPAVSGPTGQTISRGTEFNNRAAPALAAPPPTFEEGKKMYTQDQLMATGKATALKPLEEAYDMAKLVSTGPGTDTLNKARNWAVNAGLIKADEKSPNVVYAVLNKNLAQFIDKNGSRSDADLAIKESSNPNAKTQIQPALLHMVQRIIGREKVEIARPGAFEGSDYSGYGKHSSSFPTSQDERAYSIDKMPVEDARQLYIDMKNKAINGKGAERQEGIKFLKSLATAKKAGLINGIN